MPIPDSRGKGPASSGGLRIAIEFGVGGRLRSLAVLCPREA
jgi:hypothetical protein